MKRVFISLLLLSSLHLLGCNFPSIFGADNPQAQLSQVAEPRLLLQVEITGGFAGVFQQLTVDDSGMAIYIDSFHPGARWVYRLSEDELQALVNLFQDFSDLEREYVDTQVADAFFYAITFYESDLVKTVNTDNFAAPDALKRIVVGLIELIAKITGNGLDLELQLSKTEIVQGESVDLTLLVTNSGQNPLTLHFSSGQFFDFFASRDQQSDPRGTRRTVLWNWAHDKAFTLSLQDVTLAPGKSQSYQVSWDGVSNDGTIILGEVVVGAELVSVPGGSPTNKVLQIKGSNR